MYISYLLLSLFIRYATKSYRKWMDLSQLGIKSPNLQLNREANISYPNALPGVIAIIGREFMSWMSHKMKTLIHTGRKTVLVQQKGWWDIIICIVYCWIVCRIIYVCTSLKYPVGKKWRRLQYNYLTLFYKQELDRTLFTPSELIVRRKKTS